MSDKPGKEPFVSQSDRPEVRLKSDTPISELTVRDLATILGQLGTQKDFWDGKDWQKDDFDGQNKPWKDGKESKEFKVLKGLKGLMVRLVRLVRRACQVRWAQLVLRAQPAHPVRLARRGQRARSER